MRNKIRLWLVSILLTNGEKELIDKGINERMDSLIRVKMVREWNQKSIGIALIKLTHRASLKDEFPENVPDYYALRKAFSANYKK